MSVMLNSLPFLWHGLLVTLQVSAIVVVISLVCGVLLGVGLSFGPRWIAWPIRIYSDLIRGLPLLVLIFSVYYMLPLTGWNVTSFWAAVSALAAFQTAHVIEVTRGAVQSIPPGQHEAGKAIGLTSASACSTSCSRRRCGASCRPGSTPWWPPCRAARWCRWSASST